MKPHAIVSDVTERTKRSRKKEDVSEYIDVCGLMVCVFKREYMSEMKQSDQ
jgi:hypothetical protein